MTVLWKITDWSAHFENNRTRELKAMAWLPVPIKLAGDGYSEIIDHPNGAAHFGAWIAILQVAAGCDERGTLMRGNRNGVRSPHDAQSISRITRIPVSIIEEAVVRLIDVGWMTAVPCDNPASSCGEPALTCDNPAPPCGMPAPRASRAEQNYTTENRTTENNTPTHPGRVAQEGTREEQPPRQGEEMKAGAPPPTPVFSGSNGQSPNRWTPPPPPDPEDEAACEAFGEALLAAWPAGHVNPVRFQRALLEVWRKGLIRRDGTEPRTEKSRTAGQVLADMPLWKAYHESGARPKHLETYLTERCFQVPVPRPLKQNGKAPAAPKEWNPGVTAQRLERARAKMFRRPERQIDPPADGESPR